MGTEQYVSSAIPYAAAIAVALIFLALLRVLRARISLPSLPLAAGIVIVLVLAIPQVAPGNALLFGLLPLAVGIAFLCVQPQPSSTPVLLRAIALTTGLEGCIALPGDSLLPAAAALGVAGLMLFLADRSSAD